MFGQTIADGVLAEILFAQGLEKPIRYFTIANRAEHIREIAPDELNFEREVYSATHRSKERLLTEILGHPPAQLTLFENESEE